MERIAAIVVTYNRKDLLLQCLDRLLTQKGADCDVLVVDNASTDGTEQAVSQLKNPRIFYRNTGANLGGAGGFNFGMRCAVEAGYDYLWIMDDDTLPNPDALAELWAAHGRLNGEYGFLSSTVLWTDGKECRMNRQKIRKRFFERIELLQFGMVQIEQATFVSLFFPAQVVVEEGLPIKEFFIWGDDIEYTRRLSVRGKRACYLVGKSIVVHQMQNNTGSNIATDLPQRINRYHYAFRNESYTYRQEGIRGICYYLAKCGLNICRILRQAKDHRFRRCATLLVGMAQGAVFWPKVEYAIKPETEGNRQKIAVVNVSGQTEG